MIFPDLISLYLGASIMYKPPQECSPDAVAFRKEAWSLIRDPKVSHVGFAPRFIHMQYPYCPILSNGRTKRGNVLELVFRYTFPKYKFKGVSPQ